MILFMSWNSNKCEQGELLDNCMLSVEKVKSKFASCPSDNLITQIFFVQELNPLLWGCAPGGRVFDPTGVWCCSSVASGYCGLVFPSAILGLVSGDEWSLAAARPLVYVHFIALDSLMCISVYLPCSSRPQSEFLAALAEVEAVLGLARRRGLAIAMGGDFNVGLMPGLVGVTGSCA